MTSSLQHRPSQTHRLQYSTRMSHRTLKLNGLQVFPHAVFPSSSAGQSSSTWLAKLYTQESFSPLSPAAYLLNSSYAINRQDLAIYHFTPIRLMAVIKTKQNRNSKCWQRCGDIGSLCLAGWECETVQPVEGRMVIPQKVKHRITI